MHRERGESLKTLRGLYPYLKPYRLQIAGFLLSLGVGAASVLAMGLGLKYLVDEGFAKANPALLDQSLIVLFVIVFIMGGSTYARFFLISW